MDQQLIKNGNTTGYHIMDIELLLYTNIDLKLRNKLHGPMHCKIGVTCVYNGHVFILSCYNTTIYSTYFSIQQSV